MSERTSCIVGHIQPFNRITDAEPGHGALYQGMRPLAWVRQIPGPLVIVNLDCDVASCAWLDHQHTFSVLELQIKDEQDATLPDAALLAAAEYVTACLRGGLNVFVHCAMGSSRSSYLTLAVLMRAYGMDLEQATDHLKARHDIARPNRGFREHLERLEGRLREGRPCVVDLSRPRSRLKPTGSVDPVLLEGEA